jgi:hypothetical protein
MATSKKEKGAHRGNGDALQKDEQVCWPLTNDNTSTPAKRQALRLSRAYVLTYATAVLIAELAFAGGPR